MGNASFWVQGILTDEVKLPTQREFTQNDSTRLHLGPLVWDKNTREWIDRDETRKFFDQLREWNNLETLPKSCFPAVLKNLINEKLSQELIHRELSFKKNFSYDIVFSIEDLEKGLGLKENQPRDINQGIIEEKLGVYTRNNWEKCQFFDDFIIFNARKQELQIVYGMQSQYLRMLIGGAKPIKQLTDPAQRDARAHIINAFSMMNADGSEPRSVDFHSFRGAFTPEFYPRRFALKDSIYSQRLDLLAFLLRNALYRFSTCVPPVKYCEFSVGCSDLSRPWIFDVLRTFSCNGKFGKFRTLVDGDHFKWLKTNGFEKAIDYRFLAGFNRSISRINHAYSTDKSVIFLFEIPHYAIHLMLRELYRSDNQRPTILFIEQVEKLQELEKESDANANSDFFDWVVGLDLFGDELGFPYCPFVAYEFLRFLRDASEKNKAFGVRIHCAENVPFVRPKLPGYRLFAAHMYIIYRCIEFLKDKLRSNIRVGHGIAFDKLLSIKNYKYRKSNVLVAEIRNSAKSLFSSIPFEVNITSNFYLLGDAIRNTGKKKPLSNLHLFGVPVILSTDDDGIWPIDNCPLGHEEHHSLAAEYCRAITTRFITEQGQLTEMIHYADTFRFSQKESPQENENSTAKTDIDDITNKYFPTCIIVHPDVFYMLSKRMKSCSTENCYYYKYHEDLYKTEKFSENKDGNESWTKYCERIAPIAVAFFYLTRSLPYVQFETEYEKLFDYKLCMQTYDACENVYVKLMNDALCQGVSMHIRIRQKNYLFCSELPDNYKDESNFLLSIVDKYIIKAQQLTIFSFSSSMDPTDPKINSALIKIEEKIKNKEITIYIHTNTKKDSVFVNNKSGKLRINYNPKKRTDPLGQYILCALYAICPHGSVATAALNFIASEIDKSLSIEPQDIELHELIIPFLPLHVGWVKTLQGENNKTAKEKFSYFHTISNTNLERKIKVEDNTVNKCIYDQKFATLCTDIRYAEQIETKNLINKICDLEPKDCLELLKTLCKSIDEFNLWPRSFVLLDKIKEYSSYQDLDHTSIAMPIIEVKGKFLICSSADFFENAECKTSAERLWSLAVSWNPPLYPKNNPFDDPYSRWVKSILRIDRQTLDDEFEENTWERFLEIVLTNANEQVWLWFTVSRWCDIIENAFSYNGNLESFVKFLQKEKHEQTFIKLLDNNQRYKLGNRWQKEIIDKHNANQHLEEIRKLLN